MSERLVVIGGSAGSLEPLKEVVARLPADLAASVLVVMHIAPSADSALPRILDRTGPLPARHAQHGERLAPGRIFVAPPDRHLVIRGEELHLSRGPRENRHRPSVDALFNSAARWHGPAVVAVVLSGVLDDGSAGAAAVAAQDGVVLVQDPDEARCQGMPDAVIRAVRRARRARAVDIGPMLAQLLAAPTPVSDHGPDDMLTWESDKVDSEPVEHRDEPPAKPAALGCPECHGGMFEAASPNGVHYVCYVGHSWSPETLVAAQREASEAALYNAASKLREEVVVLRRLADEETAGNGSADPERATRLRGEADEAQRRADEIEKLIRQQA